MAPFTPYSVIFHNKAGKWTCHWPSRGVSYPSQPQSKQPKYFLCSAWSLASTLKLLTVSVLSPTPYIFIIHNRITRMSSSQQVLQIKQAWCHLSIDRAIGFLHAHFVAKQEYCLVLRSAELSSLLSAALMFLFSPARWISLAAHSSISLGNLTSPLRASLLRFTR